MAADGSLYFNTKIDEKGFNRGTNSITASLGKMKSSLVKIGSAIGIAFGLKQIAAFGKTAVEIASDLQEVQNVVDTAFGSMAYKMEEFAEKAIKTYGISKLTAKQTGSIFMAMASSMGIAQSKAADMSITLTGLSADMASFYNKEQEEIFTALKSVFTGETETLKNYGIVMTEVNLQQFAYTQGINKKISAMTQAEKVQLRYNYVLAQTSLAQGDFARTSGSWANQTRILKEQWNEFAGVVGTALINIVLPAVRRLNAAMTQLISFANRALNIFAQLFGWEINAASGSTSAMETQADAIGAATENQNALTDAAKKTAKENERQLAGFDKINKLQDKSSSASSGSSGTVSGAGGGSIKITAEADTDTAETKLSSFAKRVKDIFGEIEKWWNNNFSDIFSHIWDGLVMETETMKSTLSGVFSDIQSLGDPLKEYFSGDFTTHLQTAFAAVGIVLVGLFDSFNMVFDDIWNVAIFPLISKLSTDFLPVFTQINTQLTLTLGNLFTELKTLFDMFWTELVKPALETVTDIITDAISSIKEAWDKWGKPIFDNVRKAIEETSETIQNLWNTYLKPIWDALVAAVKEIWKKHLKPLLDNFLDFVGEVVNGALEIYNKFILPVVNWFINKFGPPISALFTKIVTVIKTAIGRVIDIVNSIVTALKGIVQFIVGVFTGDWEKAWTGIKNFFGGIWEALVTIVTSPIKDIQKLVGNLKDWIGDRWQDIKNFFNEIPQKFSEWFSDAWDNIKRAFSMDKAKRFFSDVLDGIKTVFSTIPKWFSEKFSDAWQKVKDVFSSGGKVFSGIKDGILNALKSVINALIRGINTIIATPFKGINTALSRVRDISIAGVQPFKNRISLINVPSIPYLASGTVVPANYGEFLAVLGDNKRETEVVSPISTIKQALSEVLAAKSGNENINLTVELDGSVIYKTVVERNRQNFKKTGVNALGY